MSRKITRAQVDTVRKALEASQGYKCLLCDVDLKKMVVKKGKRVKAHTSVLDHCHNHGHVRGILCNNCNGMEGQIFSRANRCKRDRTAVAWLRDLVDYLEKHETPQTEFIHPEHKTAEDKRKIKNTKARSKYAQDRARILLNGRKNT